MQQARKVSTTSQFGTPNGVVHCSISPQGLDYPHNVQGRVLRDDDSSIGHAKQRELLGIVKSPKKKCDWCYRFNTVEVALFFAFRFQLSPLQTDGAPLPLQTERSYEYSL